MNVEQACRDRHRRERVRRVSNGIDYAEPGTDRSRLTIHFFNTAPAELRPQHVHLVHVESGRRLAAVSVAPSDRPGADPAKAVDLSLAGAAAPASYRLTLSGREDIDPLYASVDVNFAEGGATSLDCARPAGTPAPVPAAPRIDYLAKDYDSFRRLMFDRLATTLPAWRERHVPDLGVAVVELLAYVADQLSYYQDAVATESHLGTARRRVSVRRHARLVDYQMHEGCNARAWLHLRLASDAPLDLADTFFITSCRATGDDRTALLPAHALELVPDSEYEVFEPLLLPSQPTRVEYRSAHNQMSFYTWGSQTCWLRRGATSATLLDGWVGQGARHGKETAGPARRLNLSPGDILIFEERRSPATGTTADADRLHRHAVRLVNVERAVDRLFDDGLPVVNVSWAADDALPFDLCLATRGPAPERETFTDMAVALGNVILVDHGRALVEEPEGWRLAGRNPTCRVPLPKAIRSAAALLRQTPHTAIPSVALLEQRVDGRRIDWTPCLDLLDSDSTDSHFVVEIDDERVATMRLGGAPMAGSRFTARYRVGNGDAGNVGADTIRHVVSRSGVPVAMEVRNPLAATGGVDPEATADVKLKAPGAFRRSLERAVTADDYARLAERHPDVQRAAAFVRWTGARQAVVVSIDPRARTQAAAGLLSEIKRTLFRYRRIGHDLRVAAATYAPLDMKLRVRVKDGYLRGHVSYALLEAFSNRIQADGTPGFFHPDRLTFGQAVYTSQILAAAQAVAGVDSVAIVALRRVGAVADSAGASGTGAVDAETATTLRTGTVVVGPFEIARLDNDAAHPEFGSLTLDLEGGR